MTQESVNQFFAAIRKNEALKGQCQAADDTQTCVNLAEAQGYRFTKEELQAELSKLSEEEVAELVNPDIAPRPLSRIDSGSSSSGGATEFLNSKGHAAYAAA